MTLLRIILIANVSLLCSDASLAQSAAMPRSDLPYHWLDRLDIKYNTPSGLHTSVKPVWRKDMVQLVFATDTLFSFIPDRDIEDMQWLLNENNEWQSRDTSLSEREYLDSTRTFYSLTDDTGRFEYATSRKPFLKFFYRTPAHLFEVNTKDFYLRVNPLLNFRMAAVSESDQMLFENQRGISIRGGIDKAIYFHTDILESQAQYPGYVNGFIRKFDAVPGAGFYKTYSSSIFDTPNGVDFLLANAYVGARISKHVNIELGHGRNFIGNGIRSFFLSDFTTDHFYLKLNARVWKFHYQSVFGELLRPDNIPGDQLLPKKYFAAHYLNFHVGKNLDIGLFETVVFAREDQFELQYLNPIILYRTVEGALGSPDNVLLGLDVKWNLWNRLSLYSQFILDELRFSEITSGDGWWGNKYALQMGLKYIDMFDVSHLDFQAEYNLTRPYTYSHNEGIAHYSHYNQSLAHPLGANFKEAIFRLRYQPSSKWFIVSRAMFANTGEDQDTSNWGMNILLPNDSREQDEGNRIGQGVSTQILMFGLDVSYQIMHGLFADAFIQTRRKQSDIASRNSQNNYFGLGIRWNLGHRWNEF